MMVRLILRSILYYWRTHLVVLLAVIISTAVIGGSLIVGDSVRFSLQQMTLQRLGHVTHVLHAPRFFRQQLAAEIQSAGKDAAEGRILVPAILLTGSVEYLSGESSRRRAGSVTLLGVTEASWPLLLTENAKLPSTEGIVLGHRTAAELHAVVGDRVSVWIERPSSIPRDSLLGEREDVNLEIVLTVEAVLSEKAGASRFALNPGQQLPYNAFLSLTTLQERLGLQQTQATSRNPVEKPTRVNALLAGHDVSSSDAISEPASRNLKNLLEADVQQQEKLTAALSKTVRLEDVGLVLRAVADRGYLSAESDSMILEETAAEAVISSAQHLGLESVPALVYLANEIRAVDQSDSEKRYSMYSIIAGMPFGAAAPLGPFLLADGTPIPDLRSDEIVLCDWLSRDLQVKTGDELEARWHEVGSHGDLPETHRRFRVRGILRETDPVSIDQNLTPFVDGVTNVESFSDWDQPFPMDMDRITARDDDYWASNRATPKAFVSMATAESLWKSRFGKYTSVRVAVGGTPLPEDRLLALKDRLSFEIQSRLKPDRLGMFFRPVRVEGVRASVGANDFTQLFLGFSFFLILSAILLASLMFRLGIQQRLAQVGLLEAVGISAGRARWIFLSEGLVVSLAGVVAGTTAAVAFAHLMIYGLTTWWVGAVGTQFLVADVRPGKLLIAAGITLLLTTTVIWRALLISTRRQPRELLSGGSMQDFDSAGTGRLRGVLVSLAFLLSLITAAALPVLLVAGVIPSGEAFGGMSWRVVCFFLAGFAWLFSGLLLLHRILLKRTGEIIQGQPVTGILRLAVANAARSSERSMLTTALIAFATFVIVAVGAGRRNPAVEMPDRKSGNGGFSLVAESSQSILYDLNTTEGRERLELNRDASTTLPQKTSIFGFSMRPGQDASCLNLYQATVPTLLGASPEFVRRGGFRFADTPGAEPWKLLESELPDVDGLPVVPAIGDMNTLQFSLKKGIGDRIFVPDATKPEFVLQIVGMLDGSIFQGVLVTSDRRLKEVSPAVSGQRYFLIETTPDVQAVAQAATALESALNAFGVDTEPVSQRLAGFLAVQNTYLSTFQMLGGLGLLVGTFGLTAVMMRNVVERRKEIALLKAIGFTTLRIVRLVLTENALLLFWGILTGTAAALIAMLPHLLSTGADVPWVLLTITLGGVAIVGSLSAILPVIAAAGTSIRENLSSG